MLWPARCKVSACRSVSNRVSAWTFSSRTNDLIAVEDLVLQRKMAFPGFESYDRRLLKPGAGAANALVPKLVTVNHRGLAPYLYAANRVVKERVSMRRSQ
jgi:hypothetical protein